MLYTDTTAALTETAIHAATRYLERRGYEVLTSENADPMPIVARDGNTLVFVHVYVSMDGLADPDPNAMRPAAEREAVRWLLETPNTSVDVEVRFDTMGVLVMAPDRALLRHHINAFALV